MPGYSKREARNATHLPARYNSEGVWSDVLILNVSSRGLMGACHNPPKRGEFIELRRGSSVIVVHVRWSCGRRFGARSQDMIDLSLLTRSAAAKTPLRRGRNNSTRPAGRATPTAWQIDRRAGASRHFARRFDFLTVSAAAALAAILAADTAYDALATPTDAISQALASSAGG